MNWKKQNFDNMVLSGVWNLAPKQKKSDKKKVEQSKKHQSSPSGQSKKDKKDKHNQRAAESTTASKEQVLPRIIS